MLPTTPTTARLEARISADLHANIKLVADMQERSMTDFIVSAMQEAVQRVIEQRDVIKLSLEDQTRFAPQYTGFFLILIGSLVNWPTLPTLVMFPILIGVYWRLALAEERDVAGAFSEEYRRYQRATGMFLPRLKK